MPDIFDQIAPASPQGGDVFDQVAEEDQSISPRLASILKPTPRPGATQQSVSQEMDQVTQVPGLNDPGAYRPVPAAPSLLPERPRPLSPGEQEFAKDENNMTYVRPKRPVRTLGEDIAQTLHPAAPVPVPTRLAQPATPQQIAQQPDAHPIVPVKTLGSSYLNAALLSGEDLGRFASPTRGQEAQYEAEQDVRPTGFAAGPRQAVGQIIRGSGNVAEGLNPNPDVNLSPQEAIELGKPLPNYRQPNAPNTPQMFKGGTEMLQGAMTLGMPAFAAGVAAAPIRAGLFYLAGIEAGEGAQWAAKQFGVSPEGQEFWHTVGFFLPNAATAATGLRLSTEMQGGARRVVAEAFGGKMKGVVSTNPEAVGVAGQVGPFKAAWAKVRGAASGTWKWGGPGGGAPNERPAEVVADDPIQAQIRQIEADAAAAAARAQAQQGGTPPGPAPGEPGSHTPPAPAGMEQGHLSPKVVEDLGRAIMLMPEAQRPGAIREAAGNLAQWIQQKGTIVMPDGKMVQVQGGTPEQQAQSAQKIAIDLTNAEVERLQKVQADEAKQQFDAQQKAIKDATKQAEDERKAQEDAAKQAEKDAADAAKQAEDQRKAEEDAKKKAIDQAGKVRTNKKGMVLTKDGRVSAYTDGHDFGEGSTFDSGLSVSAIAFQPVHPDDVPEGAQVSSDGEFVLSVEKQGDPAKREDLPQVIVGKVDPNAKRQLFRPLVRDEAYEEDERTQALQHKADQVAKGDEPFVHVRKGDTFEPSVPDKILSTKVDGAGAFSGTYYHPDTITPAEIRRAARAKNPQQALTDLADAWRLANPKPGKGADVAPAEPAEPEQPQTPETPVQPLAPQSGPEAPPEAQQPQGEAPAPVPATPETPAETPLAETEKPALKVGDRVKYTTNKGKPREAKVVRIDGENAYIRDGDSTIKKATADLEVIPEGTPAATAKPTSSAGQMKLTQDWGVESITGDSNDPLREEGNPTKDKYLAEGRNYLLQVWNQLRDHGFVAHKDSKGNPVKPVRTNEGGPAGSGEISLALMGPATSGIYVQIGTFGWSANDLPRTKQNVVIMYRASDAKDIYGSHYHNGYAPVDLSAKELAAWLMKKLGIETKVPEAPVPQPVKPNPLSGRGAILPNVPAAPPLPHDLAGAKPRYGYQDKNFELEFEDPRDLAVYTLTQQTPNKRHDDFAKYYASAFGNDVRPEELAEHAQKVRTYIKQRAATAKPADGPLKVPSQVDSTMFPKPKAEGEGEPKDEIIHSIKNEEDGTEVQVVKRHSDGKYVVLMRDTDADEQLPSLHVFDNEKDALAKAEEWAGVKPKPAAPLPPEGNARLTPEQIRGASTEALHARLEEAHAMVKEYEDQPSPIRTRVAGFLKAEIFDIEQELEKRKTPAAPPAPPAPAHPVAMKGYKVLVKVTESGKENWYPNGITLATPEEAEKYGSDLHSRWMQSEGYKVVETDEAPNYRWDSEKGLVKLEEQGPPGPEVAPEEEPEKPLTETKPVHAFIEAVYQKLENGETLGNVTELQKLAEQHLGSSRAAGEWSVKDMFDAMEAAINRYIVKHGQRWLEMDPLEALAELKDFEQRLTSQGTRTDEQVKLQQFSTPPRESFLVAWVAHLFPTDVDLEPSAGNGGLAAWPMSIGAMVHVNEIAPRRQEMLRVVGFSEPTAHNGEVIHALLDLKIKPTVITMNPPFSSGVHGSDKHANKFGYNHVDSALQRLQDGGRLVAILGGGRDIDVEGGASFITGSGAEWFKKLAKMYNVRANIRVSGKEYQKYGTAFSTRIIVIDKTGPTKSLDDVVKGNVDTLEQAYELLKGIAADRKPIVAAATGTGNAPVAQGQRPGGSLAPSPRPSGGGGGGAIQPGGANPPRPAVSSPPSPPAGGAGGHGPGGRPQPAPVSAPPSGPVAPQGNGPHNPPAGVPGDIHPAGPAIPAQEPSVEAADIERVENEGPEEKSDEAFVKYKPSIKGGAHPGDIVESKTMATVALPPMTYKPRLPKKTLEEDLSAVQLEAVVLSGQAHETRLPGSNARATMLIGDGTGVGKGREAAGIILDNWNQGRRRILFVTQRPALIPAIKRDLINIGGKALADGLQELGEWKGAEDVDHEGVVFSSYAMMPKSDANGNRRIMQIQKWLRGNDEAEGGLVVLDESHNLKNAVTGGGRAQPSQTGVAVRQLLVDNPNLRVSPLSATAASDIYNLGYLDRLGLWGPGTAFPGGFDEFAQRIGQNGVSAMELVARELKAQGRYVSRTLSFDGCEYDEIELKLNDDQKELYKTASEAWEIVHEAVDRVITQVTNGGARQRSNFMSQFYSSQLRFFSVLLTALKIPLLIPHIEQQLAAGNSVVITLINTNEAAQNREKTRAATNPDEDDEPPDYDFGPAEMLVTLVHNYFPVQQYADGFNSAGQPIKIPVEDAEGRPVLNPEAVRQRDELEARLKRDLKMPANPLDILIEALGGASKVAEMTGRQEYFDEATQKFVPRGEKGTPRKKINEVEQRNFQSGKKRIAVLSSAADTGIDLHSSLKEKNQQRRIHYTLQVGWSADKIMQMLGRTHRTEEANQPFYYFPSTDMGGEKRFISIATHRLATLNAISKGQKNVGGAAELLDNVDFMSEQGRTAARSFYDQLEHGAVLPGLTIVRTVDELPDRDKELATAYPAGTRIKWHPGRDNNEWEYGKTTEEIDADDQYARIAVKRDDGSDRAIYRSGLYVVGEQRTVREPMPGIDLLRRMHVLRMDAQRGLVVPDPDKTNITRLLNRLMALPPEMQNSAYNFFFDIFTDIVQDALQRGILDTGVRELPGDEHNIAEEKTLATNASTKAETVYNKIESKIRNRRLSAEGMEKKRGAEGSPERARTELWMNPRTKDVRLIRPAPAIVRADGTTTEARYEARPGHGDWAKVEAQSVTGHSVELTQHVRGELKKARERIENLQANIQRTEEEDKRYGGSSAYYKGQVARYKQDLETAKTELAKVEAEYGSGDGDPWAYGSKLWQEQYDAYPTHRTSTTHIISGAVLGWFGPIRDALGNGRLEIYTTKDAKTGQRVVGVSVPPGQIEQLKARISGGRSALTPQIMAEDVMRNGTEYRLEGGIRVTRHRVAGHYVVRLTPATIAVGDDLRRMGVVYERGVQATYYVPTRTTMSGDEADMAVLDAVVTRYPIQQAGGQNANRVNGSTVSFMGAGYAQQAVSGLYRYGKQAAPATLQDIVKAAGLAGRKAKHIGREIVAALYPRALADEDAKDIMGRAIGDPALALFKAAELMRSLDGWFKAMPQDDWVDFIDRWQNGDPQPNQELTDAQDLMQGVIDGQRAEEQHVINLGRKPSQRITLENRPNYFPNRYKRPPDSVVAHTGEDMWTRLHGMAKRPFEGSKKFLKEQKYTLRQAIDEGAIPLNGPVEILMARLQEGAKFVAAKRAMHSFKRAGLVMFLKKGQPMPNGYTRIDDKIANVWRPIETMDGGIYFKETGEWVGQEDAMRLLNNYLSRDYVRDTETGRALVGLKNATTEMCLSFSPFHFMYITVETWASAINTALDKLYNRGVRQGDAAALKEAVVEAFTAVLAPYTAIKQGGRMIQYARNPSEFLLSPEGHEFAQEFPDYDHLQTLLFEGGGRWGMPQATRVSLGEGFMEALKTGHLGEAMLRATPWLSHLAMGPLFEHYIPRAKWTWMVQMLSTKLRQYSYAIAQGKMTEIQIAREVVSAAEYRFGEFNFDNLYWQNWFKTVNQLAFRSVSWKAGTWLGLGKAGYEQFSSKMFDDHSYERFAGAGQQGPQGQPGSGQRDFRRYTSKLPQLGINAGWLIAMAAVVATLSTLMKLINGKFPWEWAADEHEKGQAFLGAMALEAMHPRTGVVDQYGEPVRLSFPTGLKDYEHALFGPRRYVMGSLSDWVGTAWNTLANEDAFGDYVFNPHADPWTQFTQGLTYNLKGYFLPISVKSFLEAPANLGTGARIAQATGLMRGAPKELQRSHALNKALEMRAPHMPLTPEQKHERQLAKEHPNATQIRRAAREKNIDYLERVVLYQLNYFQVKEIVDDKDTTPQERKVLYPIMLKKMRLMMKSQAGRQKMRQNMAETKK